jgi:hypothetical protein
LGKIPTTSERLPISRLTRFQRIGAAQLELRGQVAGEEPGNADLDAELRREAQTTGKTLNALVVEALEQAKLPSSDLIYEDLDWFVGSAPAGESGSDATQAWLDALPGELA